MKTTGAFLAVLAFFTWVTPLQAQKRTDKDFTKAQEAFQKKDYPLAITLLGKVIVRYPDHVAAYRLRAESFYAIKDYQSAINDYTKAIEIAPNDADLYIGRAEAYRAMGNLNAALQDLDAAILLDKQMKSKKQEEKEKLLNYRGRLNLQAGNYANALIDYQTLSEMYPNNSNYLDTTKLLFEKVEKEELAGLIELGKVTLSGSPGGVTPSADDQKTTQIRNYIKEHKFSSIEEGRSYYQQLIARTDLPKGKKTVLLSLLREKILFDVFGEHPYLEEIEAMKRLVETENWINPEGKQRYFQLINNSRYWFTGGVQRGDTYYFYKVMKSRYATNKYRMQMFAVVNNASNLVLNGEVVVDEDTTGRRVIEVPAVENKGYMWVTSKTDKLRGITTLENNNIQFESAGNLARFASSSAGLVAPQQYENCIKPQGPDLNDAIKATLNYLILEYSKMFVLR
ncbi:MAG: tetratricopeptide repeat protein [Cytophagales bacterium]|nr:tetratricopeptide repeat protein [Bernardetiaceae bacterium]MDW8210002.1 tetratricopeptide repeat protein [Cytophagales bacterium]